MTPTLTRSVSRALGTFVALAWSVLASSALAHETMGAPHTHFHTGKVQTIIAEEYIPTIWVDPDGCEHWVMDDGFEGFMTLKVDREGRPTCHQQSICVTIPGSAFHRGGISAHARKQVMDFFARDDSNAYKIIGHTNITGNDRRNVSVSEARARVVASLGQRAGRRIVGIDGHGGRHPVVHPSSAENSRVEVLCLR